MVNVENSTRNIHFLHIYVLHSLIINEVFYVSSDWKILSTIKNNSFQNQLQQLSSNQRTVVHDEIKYLLIEFRFAIRDRRPFIFTGRFLRRPHLQEKKTHTTSLYTYTTI